MDIQNQPIKTKKKNLRQFVVFSYVILVFGLGLLVLVGLVNGRSPGNDQNSNKHYQQAGDSIQAEEEEPDQEDGQGNQQENHEDSEWVLREMISALIFSDPETVDLEESVADVSGSSIVEVWQVQQSEDTEDDGSNKAEDDLSEEARNEEDQSDDGGQEPIRNEYVGNFVAEEITSEGKLFGADYMGYVTGDMEVKAGLGASGTYSYEATGAGVYQDGTEMRFEAVGDIPMAGEYDVSANELELSGSKDFKVTLWEDGEKSTFVVPGKATISASFKDGKYIGTAKFTIYGFVLSEDYTAVPG